MLNLRRLILSTIILTALTSATLHGQYYTLGADPGRARWMSITSDHYRIIFPEETDSMARVFLYTLEKMRPAVMAGLDISPRPIPVVLHPYTTLSNGSVAWAPKRMDLFSSPDPYGSNPDSWAAHLTVHESRHTGQMEHFTKGIYNVFYYLLGEQVSGLGVGLFVSTHVLEGDAVMTETELTGGGRGRNADFTKYMRAMYLNGDYRNWDRLVLGSHRHYTPSAYTFGYLHGGYIRYESGYADLAGRMLGGIVRDWYSIGTLIDPIKGATGISDAVLFRRSQKVLTEMWRQDYLSRGRFTCPHSLKAKNDRLYTEITDPVSIGGGSIVALKEGMEIARKMIMIDSCGKEHFLRHFNPVSSRLFYDGHSKIYWSETVSGGPAALEDFSTIMYLDLSTGRTRTLGQRTKYFNPAPSVTGDTLAVAEYPVEGSTYLTLISSRDGSPLVRYKAPGQGQIREPVFDGDTIYSSVILEDGIGIFRLHDGAWHNVIAPQRQSISGLRIYGRCLYFSSDLDGVVNIYRYSLDSGTLRRLTNSEYGADYPYFDSENGRLYYCEYGLGGYRPVYAAADRLQDTVMSFDRPYSHPLAEFLTAQTDLFLDSSGTVPVETSTFDTGKYPARRYSKLLHAFRIHSWFPVYVDVDRIMTFSFERFSQVASPGVTILSQNSLGDITTSLSYGYVRDWNTGRWFHSGHFTADAALFRNLSAEVRLDVNERNTMTHGFDLTLGTQTVRENLRSPLLSVSAMLYWPLSFNSRGWYRSLTPFVSWLFSNDEYHIYSFSLSDNSIQQATGTPFMRHQIQYGLSYGQVIPTAQAQIYPRWGFGITARGVSSPVKGGYFKDLFYANGYAYLPGITRQQGLKISFAVQQQFGKDRLMTTSTATLPRGYNRYSFADTYINLSADYAVPVYLGDFRLGPVLYFKRLQLIPFVDYGMELNPGTERTDYLSYGADLLADFNIIRLSFPISAGVRYARTGPDGNSTRNHFEFLFNIAF